MKKITTLLLAMLMALSLAACSGDNTAAPAESEAAVESTETVAESTEAVEETTAEAASEEEAKGLAFTVVVTDLDGTETTFEYVSAAATVGEALLADGLIAGEDSDYGLYVTSVNGITADWDADQTYWAFYINGEYATTGVDSTEITEGATYSFILTGSEETTAETESAADVTVLGEGAAVFAFTVADLEGAETAYEIHTDESTVGAALLELGVIEGEDGEYGLYVNSVNGITADWDKEQTYWAFYIDGEYATTGVDSTEITEGCAYSFVLTKG